MKALILIIMLAAPQLFAQTSSNNDKKSPAAKMVNTKQEPMALSANITLPKPSDVDAFRGTFLPPKSVPSNDDVKKIANPQPLLKKGGADAGGVALVATPEGLKLLQQLGYYFDQNRNVTLPKTDDLENYVIEKETRESVKLIAKYIGDALGVESSVFWKSVLENPSVFHPVEKIDSRNRARMDLDYGDVLIKNGYSPHLGEFIYGAYSNNGHTFILPVFKKLKPWQQALALYHEAAIRQQDQTDMVERLAIALEMDSALYRFLESPTDASPETKVNLDLAFSKIKAFGIIKWNLPDRLFSYFFAKANKPVLASDFVKLPSSSSLISEMRLRQISEENKSAILSLSSIHLSIYTASGGLYLSKIMDRDSNLRPLFHDDQGSNHIWGMRSEVLGGYYLTEEELHKIRDQIIDAVLDVCKNGGAERLSESRELYGIDYLIVKIPDNKGVRRFFSVSGCDDREIIYPLRLY